MGRLAYLIEFVVEHILIVCQRNDELHDQLTSPGDDSAASPPVGVLPADAIVLLMDTDDVGGDLTFTVRSSNDAIKVLDYTKAVASELEVVGAVSKTTITKVEGLFAVERGARVGVGYGLANILAKICKRQLWNNSPSH